ncbi:hypothetical protein C8J57DRAFT_1134949, partial [Mycena rebaudengoi]
MSGRCLPLAESYIIGSLSASCSTHARTEITIMSSKFSIRKFTTAAFLLFIVLKASAEADFDWTQVKASKDLNWTSCYSEPFQCARLE